MLGKEGGLLLLPSAMLRGNEWRWRGSLAEEGEHAVVARLTAPASEALLMSACSCRCSLRAPGCGTVPDCPYTTPCSPGAQPAGAGLRHLRRAAEARRQRAAVLPLRLGLLLRVGDGGGRQGCGRQERGRHPCCFSRAHMHSGLRLSSCPLRLHLMRSGACMAGLVRRCRSLAGLGPLTRRVPIHCGCVPALQPRMPSARVPGSQGGVQAAAGGSCSSCCCFRERRRGKRWRRKWQRQRRAKTATQLTLTWETCTHHSFVYKCYQRIAEGFVWG